MKPHKPVHLIASALVTPLGIGTEYNLNALIAGESAIQIENDARFFPTTLPLAKIADEVINHAKKELGAKTRFESLLLSCLHEIKKQSVIDLSAEEVLVILSTTKGNIELMEVNDQDHKLFLADSSQCIQHFLGQSREPMIISNACISGLSAMIVAKRLLEAGHYTHALIIGCDVLTHFVISGFSSFHALSQHACKPFDINRDGINLGEAGAALILSTSIKSNLIVQGGFVSNDANHISGPSKTGEELSYCINESIRISGLKSDEIDFVSAHGTATPYNDEMESKAFELSHLQHAPVFSLKGGFGHTLGASGILEMVIAMECLKRGIILPSIGFNEKGVSGDIQVSNQLVNKEMKHCLKTASGFGGCNAAIIISKTP